MRPFSFLLALISVGTVSATELHTFSSGKPVVSQDVNENFSRLDTAIQNRASKAGLDATITSISAIQTTVGTLQSGKADVSALTKKADTVNTNPVSRRVDVLGKSKQDVLGFLPVNKAGDSISGSLKVAGGGYFGPEGGTALSQNYPLSVFSKGFTNVVARTDGKAAGAGFVAQSPSGTWEFGTRDDLLGNSTAGSWVINDISSAKVWGDKSSMNVLTPLNVQGVLTISEALSVGGGVLRLYPQTGEGFVYGALYGDKIATPNGANYSMAWKRDGTEAVINGDGNYVQVTSTGNTIKGNTTFTDIINGKFVTNGIPASHVADYVFEPGYQLTSLSEIESFAKANKHLPEVPSASEIEKGGLDLAQMNLTLLKKVEELTLHAIAQQKEIDAQKSLVAEQKSQFELRLERLESRLR